MNELLRPDVRWPRQAALALEQTGVQAVEVTFSDEGVRFQGLAAGIRVVFVVPIPDDASTSLLPVRRQLQALLKLVGAKFEAIERGLSSVEREFGPFEVHD